MLEGLAAWVLNTYIGEYLENLNTDQLSIGLLQGYAELENVPLKRTALRKFDVPFCVRAGVIGKLTLSVPLTHLKSQPWVLTVSDLYVVLEPSHSHYDVEFEAQYKQEKKKAQLDALEIMHKKRLVDNISSLDAATAVPEDQQSPSGGGWWAYGASVVSSIVENIQLIASNVHIRYEDDVTIPGCLFACGIKIEGFSVQSAHSSWTPGFVTRGEGDNMRKLVELKGFSVYWDSGGGDTNDGCKLMAPVNHQDLMQKMKESEIEGLRHHYLLSPLTLRVRMEKNTSKIPLKTIPPSPRFKFDLEPERVSLQGSRKQFTELRLLVDEWHRYHRNKPYRKWRPKAALSRETAKQWWKFAIICHLERIRQRNERRTWRYAISRARQVNAYCKAYIRILASKVKESTKGDEALTRQIEREYEFDELQLLREGALRYGIRTGQLSRCQLSVSPPVSKDLHASPSSSSLATTPVHTPRAESQQQSSDGGYLAGWLGSWWSGNGNNEQNPGQQLSTSETVETRRNDAAFQEEIQKVEQVLEEELWDIYNETMDESAVMGRDLLFAAVSLSMKSLNIAFASDDASGSEAGVTDLSDVHRCLTDASLDLGLRLRYLTDPENRQIVTPCFELSATFGSGLNLRFDSRQYESALEALAGWTGQMNDQDNENGRSGPEPGKWHKATLGMENGKNAIKRNERKDRVDFQLSADVQVPKLKIDLRTDFSPDTSLATEGQPLVSILCEKVAITYHKKKPHICVVETSMESFLVIDTLEGSVKTPTLPHLMKATGSTKESTLEPLSHSFLSTSCPDISCEAQADDSSILLSSSLPSARASPPAFFPPSFKQTVPLTPPPTPTCRWKSDEATIKEKPQRSATSTSSKSYTPPTDEKKRRDKRLKRQPGEHRGNPGRVRIIVTLIDSVHEEFQGAYKQIGSLINIEAGDLEFVVNQQTLIIFLDFFGLLASSTTAEISVGGNSARAGSPAAGGKVQVELDIQSLKVVMNKPSDGYQLGSMVAYDLQACLISDEVGFSLNGQACSFKVTDETPVYSRLYAEKLSFGSDGEKSLQFLFYKYKNADHELKREFDACLALYAEDDLYYVHSQRYLTELIQFWNRFAELYDFYGNAKSAGLGIQRPDFISRGFRLKLRIDLRRTLVFLPTSSLDASMIVADINRLVADNDFLFSSLLEEGRQSTSQDDHDCLMDVMQLHLEDVQLHEGVRLSDEERDIFADTSRCTDSIFAKGKRPLVDFKSFSIVVDAKELLDRPLSLDVSVARNLDTSLARTVPDMAVHTAVNLVNLRLHTSTYAVFRAFMDHNLGEELPPQQSSSMSIAQVACEVNGPWTTLEVTCDLNNVLVDCFTASPDELKAKASVCHLAQVDLEQAKFSFESFCDGTRHIDLVCNDVRLFDTRFDDEAANKRENVFSTIFGSSDLDVSHDDRSSASKDKRHADRLMGEIHYAMERQCSTLTLVFSRARLLCATEWLLLTKAFLLTEMTVRKVTKQDWTNSVAKRETHTDRRKLDKWKPHRADVLAKTRVVTRAELEDMNKENFKLKATLLESEIVFLEKPSSRNSLAVTLKVTASLYFENVNDCMKLECRDSQLQLFDCVYGNKKETTTALTSVFSCIAEFAAVTRTTQKTKYVNLGLLETVPHVRESRLKMTLSNLMAKLSYRDWLVLRTVWDAYMVYWEDMGSSSIQKQQHQQQKQHHPHQTADDIGTVIERIDLRLESVSFCFLDDYQETRFPLFKLSLNEGIVEHRPGKSIHDPHEGSAALAIEVYYFNQKVYGWEPFVETWRADNLSWSYNPSTNAMCLEILCDKRLDFTVTKTFIQQTQHFLNYWPNLSKSLAKDFRSGFTKRLDILPYILVNQTGSILSFATCLSGQRGGSSGRKISTNKWIRVVDGETQQFSFESHPWQVTETESTDPFLSRHIVIRVDGWHEINPIPVDAVGTFSRLARLDNAKKSSLSHAVSCTRLVAAVSIDRDGRKVITVRSALMFVNGLMNPLTVRLEVTGFVAEHTEFVLTPGAVRPAPLGYANSKVLVRPATASSSWSYCKPISWSHVTQRDQAADDVRTSTSLDGARYRMRVSVKAESYPKIHVDGGVIPGHTLTFVPPLIVHNLLPLDLHVNVANPPTRTTIADGQWAPFVEVDPLESIELKFQTEYFHSRQSLFIHPTPFQQEQRHELEMIDQLRRPLILQAKLTPIKGGAVKVTISAPFWFVNRSGLPLIIKQEASEEAAGQFDEHEHARSMAPVLFSFAESGAPLKCCLRLGKLVHPDSVSDWCRSFVLEPGITFKELRSIPVADRRPARVYNIGVEVRVAQGVYKDTHVVLLTARYLIDNRSPYKLHVSQLYDAERNSTGQYTVAPNCSLAWHWPRQDLDLLLCVRRDDLAYWSSPFRIDQLKSFHLTLRDSQFSPQFLRLEIILRGSVYYVTFSSAENIPPPIRIENLTDAPILYNQKSCDASHLRAVLRPHTQVNYSFDDTQFKPPIILLTAQNGKTVEYDLMILGQGEPLFSVRRNPDEVNLVLDVLQQGKVVLARKDPQRPQQLWRMRSDGHLVNVADWSHLVRHAGAAGAVPFVLDVLPAHCDPASLAPLMLRAVDASRRLTQRWRFTEDGRLMCGLEDMYVQAEKCQLKAGMGAILAMTQSSSQHFRGVPHEQYIVRHRQRPGSGRLAVNTLLDGPTRVLRITDMADLERGSYSIQAASDNFRSIVQSSTARSNAERALELTCSCTLNGGVGLSVVNSDMEELIYCRLTGLIFTAKHHDGKYALGIKVLEIQADNQLWNAERWTLLHICSKYDEKQDPQLLALDLVVNWTPLPSYDSFETFTVKVNKVALYVDEILLWKLLVFFSDDGMISGVVGGGETVAASKLYQHSPAPNLELERPDPKQARRCYFGALNLICRRMYLSVVTANVLPPQLRQVKQMYSMPLIRFENASVEIAPFQQIYYFETVNFLLEALHKHFTQELRSQAVKILGTVDFLGNPVGLFRDVSDSLQELIISANVSGFVTGIMHGFSNSAAKITSSLSDQVGKIAMDDSHCLLRESVRQSQSQDAMGHLLTGVKGLGIGVVGGVTSVFTQPVDGMKRDGFEGLFTGVVKGVVGMVAKPVQGVLDLATGVSNATKEAVSGSDGPLKTRFPPNRLRFPRVARNLQGTLPPYSEQLAAAQRTLLSINDGNLHELCLSMDQCCTLQQQAPIFVLISTTNVYFVRRRRQDDLRVLLNIAYSQLQGCTCVLENAAGEPFALSHGLVGWQQPYLEFSLKTTDPLNNKRRIKCDSVEKATELCQKILYAKQQYEEQERSLAIPENYGIDQQM